MGNPLRLLLIEDSEADAEMVNHLLSQAGFDVSLQRVDDAEGLIRALKDSTWDMIIADYFLPSFDAPAALRILQEFGQDIPCIVVSGKMGEDTAVEMMKSGAQDYLTKNNLVRLAPAVRRELAEAEMRRASRRAHEQLRSSEDRMALAVEATQIGTFDYYPLTGDLIWSSLARRHFGVSPGKKVNFDTFVQSLHPADKDEVLESIHNAMRIGKGHEYAHEFRVVGIEDGRERWISSRGRVFFDEDMRPIRLVGVVQNVTEQRRLEQQLSQSQKLEGLGRLAGSIGNEFNNLFTVINGYTHLVLAALGTSDPNRDSMEKLSQSAVRASTLARRLVACTRQQVAEPETINVNDFVKDYESIVSRLLGENVQLELVLNPQGGAFCADPGQVGQALIDLALNAKEAMPTGGKLTIKTSMSVADDRFSVGGSRKSPGHFVEILVSDTGMGMTSEVQSHLFEPFYTTKDHGKGMGLGLSTVYGFVVHQCNGKVSVSSDAGRGTTLLLSFPALSREMTIEAEILPDRVSAHGETILLAEDEIGVRQYARRILERHGYKVLLAENGEEALSVARAQTDTIHLLLTDLVMPQMGGLDLMENFVGEFPQVPVLFMSAHPDQIMRHWNVISAYVQKPFHVSELLTQVRELLDRTAANSLPAKNLPATG